MSAVQYLHARQHPAAYLGPTFISTLVQAVETGFLLSLLTTFWRHNKEGRTIRFIVVFTSTIGLLQACFAVRDMWKITVPGFGHWEQVFAWSWFITLAPLMSAWTGIPVQAFLGCRLWMIWNRTFPLLIFLSFLVISHAIIIVVASVRQFTSGFLNLKNLSRANAFSLPIDVSILICLSASAAVDTIVTFLLVIRFVRLRLHVAAPQRQKVVDFISMLIWETGLPSCVCSLAAGFLYGFMNNYSFWYRPFQSILGKLYVFSLLITLNNRRDKSHSNERPHVTDRGLLSSIRRLDLPAPPAIPIPCGSQMHNLAHLQDYDSSRSMDVKESGRLPSRLSTLNFATLSDVHSSELVLGPPRKSSVVTDDDRSSMSVCGCGRSDCSFFRARESYHSSQTQVGPVGEVVVEVIVAGDS